MLIATAVVLVSGIVTASQERMVGSVVSEQESAVSYSDTDRAARRSLIVQRAQEEMEQMQIALAAEEAVVHASAPMPASMWMKIVDEVARWFGLTE